MKILFLCHRIPYPPNKGDKIRSFNEIKYLSKDHQIDLVCLADEPNDLKYQNELKAYCRRVHAELLNKTKSKIKGLLSLIKGGTISVGYFYNRNIQKIVNQWCAENEYDAILCFSSPMAEYLFRNSAARPPGRHMDFCDVDSDKWRQYAQKSKFPMNLIYKTEFDRLLAYEIKINQAFDHSIFVSQKEADLFKTLYPTARNLSVVPNGVDADYFNPAFSAVSHSSCSAPSALSPKLSAPSATLLFAGAMDYQANMDGVTWFCLDIYPALRAAKADLSFFIVGSNPTPKIKALANGDGIKVTGFVEDIRPYYSNADICVIPLRMARGVQNKVLEAMAMGKAIVTTSAAIQGISATPGEHLLVADNKGEFIKILMSLLNNRDQCKQLGNSAREFVTHHYDWNANMKKLNRLIQPEP